jgi:hypothetical protein
VAAAKMFKTKLGQSLPIAAQYVAHIASEEDDSGRQRATDECNKLPQEARTPCYVSFVIRRALKADAKKQHAATLQRAAELAKTGFTGMVPVRVSVRDKRPLPTVDGLCWPGIAGCFEDPCYRALPLPLTAQLGYLNADALALIEQSGLPSFADVMAHKPPQCRRTENALYAWAVRDAAPAGANAGEGRLRALLLVVCGMVEGREGPFPSSSHQLLVYGDDGRLDVVAGSGYAAALDWQTGSDGPKLAHATVSGWDASDDRDVEAVASVVATK